MAHGFHGGCNELDLPPAYSFIPYPSFLVESSAKLEPGSCDQYGALIGQGIEGDDNDLEFHSFKGCCVRVVGYVIQLQRGHRDTRRGVAQVTRFGKRSLKLNMVGQTTLWDGLNRFSTGLKQILAQESDPIFIVRIVILWQSQFGIVEIIQNGPCRAGLGTSASLIRAREGSRGPIRLIDSDVQIFKDVLIDLQPGFQVGNHGATPLEQIEHIVPFGVFLDLVGQLPTAPKFGLQYFAAIVGYDGVDSFVDLFELFGGKIGSNDVNGFVEGHGLSFRPFGVPPRSVVGQPEQGSMRQQTPIITDPDRAGQEKETFLLRQPVNALPGILPFFTTRRGGVSRSGYASFNLGLHVGDDQNLVLQNRERLKRALQPQVHSLCLLQQVHGIRAVVARPGQGDIPEADAIVTRDAGVAVAVMTADCAPVLLCDPVNRVVGAAHAGWRGALFGVVESCIDLMESLGANPQHMLAIVGPTICPPNYEVDTAFYQQFMDYHKPEHKIIVERFFLSLAISGRFQFNLPQYLVARLHERGIPREGINNVGLCTFQDEERFFSYRRSNSRGESGCGRQMGGIALVEAK